MKIALFAAAVLLESCATTAPSKMDAGKSTTNRDLSECEREAAQASAGSKAQAFDNCMRARKQTPKR